MLLHDDIEGHAFLGRSCRDDMPPLGHLIRRVWCWRVSLLKYLRGLRQVSARFL